MIGVTGTSCIIFLPCIAQCGDRCAILMLRRREFRLKLQVREARDFRLVPDHLCRLYINYIMFAVYYIIA